MISLASFLSTVVSTARLQHCCVTASFKPLDDWLSAAAEAVAGAVTQSVAGLVRKFACFGLFFVFIPTMSLYNSTALKSSPRVG